MTEVSDRSSAVMAAGSTIPKCSDTSTPAGSQSTLLSLPAELIISIAEEVSQYGHPEGVTDIYNFAGTCQKLWATCETVCHAYVTLKDPASVRRCYGQAKKAALSLGLSEDAMTRADHWSWETPDA